ncbi:SAM-dependent methyltransferase [Brevibacillus fluminis]|uniref:SAM-dependent methyltransferase n=1 Tax=Brevibacillus fluminis TaxID=511487 RepID=UPI003F8A4A7D
MIEIKPVAYVRNTRTAVEDDHWGAVQSEITLADHLQESSLAGIEEFSHIEVLFYFDQVEDEKIQYEARHPRNNPAYPKVGIFAQRGKNRPNKLGITVAKLVGRNGRSLTVTGLDAIDGTPVIDIKPVMKEFLPRSEVKQPAWSVDLMSAYWE